MTTADAIFLAVMLLLFGVIAPVLARRGLAALRQALAAGLPGARQRFYDLTIAHEWLVTAVLTGWWLLLGRSPTELGLRLAFAGWQWLALALSLVATAVFAAHTWRAMGDPRELAQVRDELDDLTLIVPHSRAELRRFGWLSLTAGICEEILYRGLLMASLAAVIGIWPAVLVSSVIFGLGHAYQGPRGVLRTGAVGLALALVVVFTGSLPAAMILHVVIDLVQGRLAWAAVNAPGPVAGGIPIQEDS